MTAATATKTQTTILYDGQCRLCQRSVRLLQTLDWLGRLHFADARDPANLAATDPPLQPERLMEEMHAVTPTGKVYHGYGAFRCIAWRVPLLWLIAPFLCIPGVPAIGQRIYLWVARNRFHLVPCHDGQCRIPLKKN